MLLEHDFSQLSCLNSKQTCWPCVCVCAWAELRVVIDVNAQKLIPNYDCLLTLTIICVPVGSLFAGRLISIILFE